MEQDQGWRFVKTSIAKETGLVPLLDGPHFELVHDQSHLIRVAEYYLAHPSLESNGREMLLECVFHSFELMLGRIATDDWLLPPELSAAMQRVVERAMSDVFDRDSVSVYFDANVAAESSLSAWLLSTFPGHKPPRSVWALVDEAETKGIVGDFKVVVEPESMKRNVSGALFGPIHLRISTVAFPHERWTDFASACLIGWYESTFHESETTVLHFMDGPYRVELIRVTDHLCAVRCSESDRSIVVLDRLFEMNQVARAIDDAILSLASSSAVLALRHVDAPKIKQLADRILRQ